MPGGRGGTLLAEEDVQIIPLRPTRPGRIAGMESRQADAGSSGRKILDVPVTVEVRPGFPRGRVDPPLRRSGGPARKKKPHGGGIVPCGLAEEETRLGNEATHPPVASGSCESRSMVAANPQAGIARRTPAGDTARGNQPRSIIFERLIEPPMTLTRRSRSTLKRRRCQAKITRPLRLRTVENP